MLKERKIGDEDIEEILKPLEGKRSYALERQRLSNDLSQMKQRMQALEVVFTDVYKKIVNLERKIQNTKQRWKS